MSRPNAFVRAANAFFVEIGGLPCDFQSAVIGATVAATLRAPEVAFGGVYSPSSLTSGEAWRSSGSMNSVWNPSLGVLEGA